MKFRLLSRTLAATKRAKARLAAHLRLRAFARHGRRRFQNDPRYNLQSVSEGFASRVDDRDDDKEILHRICAAYQKAIEKQSSSPQRYQSTERWKQIEKQSLGPVTKPLREGDIQALRSMYRNFYRDPCSAGILGAPNGQPRAYFSGKIKDIYRHFYLSHVLYRLDYWKSVTCGRYLLRDLEGPGVGNPFGVVLDGTLVSVGAEYAHYCAKRVEEESAPGPAAIAEIKGGFGAIAYFLLRDRPKTTYVDFDLPESVALATYYLMKSFPALSFLCYGEKAITQAAVQEADVVLLPLFELATVPDGLVNLTFTSFGLAAMTPEHTAQCVEDVGRISREKIFLIGNRITGEAAAEATKSKLLPFSLGETRESGWHSYKVSGAGVGGAANLADAAVVEQSYIRSRLPAEQGRGTADHPARPTAELDLPSTAGAAR